MDRTGPFCRPDPATEPPYDAPDYRSTRLRHPLRPPIYAPRAETERTGPRFDARQFPVTADLTRSARPHQDGLGAIGERIVVAGRVTDQDGRAVPGTMIELWQANAAGRYTHPRDQHPAPLDPDFTGTGRVFTDADGAYRFVTIKPGAYPWANHANAWRPNHIHFSLFGPAFATRLITQMYFPGDPLLPLDPIFMATPDPDARARLIGQFDLALTEPDWALGYRFDIVLRGRSATPFEDH